MTIEELENMVGQSISNYAKMGIDIEVLEIKDDKAIVKIAQNRLVNNLMLNQKQLVERLKCVFSDIEMTILPRPKVFYFDVANIDGQWLKLRMKELGLHTNDVVSQLAINKTTLNQYLKGERIMEQPIKAAFFYYFMTYQLNNEFREQCPHNLNTS